MSIEKLSIDKQQQQQNRKQQQHLQQLLPRNLSRERYKLQQLFVKLISQ